MARQSVPYSLKATIGKRIETLLKRNKVSRDRLGNDLDLSKSTVGKILNAVNATGLETLLAIADYFQVSMDFLLGRTKSQTPPPKTARPENLKATIGKRLDSLLERDGVSQYRLAKDLKKNQSAFGYIRSGKNAPALTTLLELADYFDVTTDFLLGRTPAANADSQKD